MSIYSCNLLLEYAVVWFGMDDKSRDVPDVMPERYQFCSVFAIYADISSFNLADNKLFQIACIISIGYILFLDMRCKWSQVGNFLYLAIF